jgi:hypothetical protein
LSEHFINPDDFKKSHKFIKRYLKWTFESFKHRLCELPAPC